MRFATDDGHFGFLVAAAGAGMFRFQLLFQGRLIGDVEPCFLESAIGTFNSVTHLDDARLDSNLATLEKILYTLETDNDLHDAALSGAAESLDSWIVYAFMQVDSVTILAEPARESGERALGQAHFARLPEAQYRELFSVVQDYWANIRTAL